MNKIDAFISECLTNLQRFEQERAEHRCEMEHEGYQCTKTENTRFCTVCESWICPHCAETVWCTDGNGNLVGPDHSFLPPKK